MFQKNAQSIEYKITNTHIPASEINILRSIEAFVYPSLVTFLPYLSRSIHYPECVYHTKYLSLYGYYGILCFKYFNIYKNVIQ